VRPVTDRTYDRWAEPSRDSWGEPARDAARDDSREPHWGETRDRWSPQGRWDGPNDPRWDDPGSTRGDETRGTRWDIPAVPPGPPPASRDVVPVRGGGSGGSSGRGRKRRRKLKLWQEIPLLVLIAFGLAFLVRTFLFQAFYIPSSSMEDTLVLGDRVLVNRVVYNFGQPERGDVVVFKGPANWAPEFQPDANASFFSKVGGGLSDLVGLGKPGEKDFIKRVVGLPGDRVSCCDVKGRVFVNGKPIDEPYVTKNANKDSPKSPGQCGPRQFDEVVVEPGMLFVMGDNRFISQDSRCRGLVPIENVIGRAGTIAWPPSRWGDLSQPDPFKNVPAPAGQAAGPPAGPLTGAAVGSAAVLPMLPPVWLARRARLRSRRLRA
jgi:signal peptidase I